MFTENRDLAVAVEKINRDVDIRQAGERFARRARIQYDA